MRKERITTGEYYHICNRGHSKQTIFLDTRDYIRFLFLILAFQSRKEFYNLSRYVTEYVKRSAFNINPNDKEFNAGRIVDVVGFCLMPNHFHLIVRQIKENGVALYMQRVLTAYSKYANTKYKKSGHFFQGPYRIVLVEDNEQLIYLSAYVHRNPRDLAIWRGKEDRYRWSTYQDYLDENRWGKLIKPDIVLSQFKSKNEYRKSVESSAAKEKEFKNLHLE